MNDSTPASVLLAVRVKPRAKRAALLGWHGGALKLAVRAAPERGRANEEVVSLLAQALGLPTDAVTLVAGGTSQSKRVRISGLDAPELQRRIDIALAGGVE
jgi:uncharacterized protein